jgi:hypothetical protein
MTMSGDIEGGTTRHDNVGRRCRAIDVGSTWGDGVGSTMGNNDEGQRRGVDDKGSTTPDNSVGQWRGSTTIDSDVGSTRRIDDEGRQGLTRGFDAVGDEV